VVLLGNRGGCARCLLVWASGTAGLGAAARGAAPAAVRGWSARGSLSLLPFDRALVDLAAAVLLACTAWAWLALTATVLEALRGVPRADPGRARTWRLPGGLRRLVLAGCGVALVSGVVSPAVAAGRSQPPPPAAGPGVLVGLPLPDRAVAPPAPAPAVAHPGAAASVVVRPGDCLWTIAARDLTAGASGAAVEARWRAIYAANRALIGPDPDLLTPGQRLLLPRKAPS
jgi:hypothetical protein